MVDPNPETNPAGYQRSVPQQTGKADHAAPSPAKLSFVQWLRTAQKALVAFLVAGGGTTLATQIATFDWSNWSLRNLWTGIGVGLVSAFVVYWTKNHAAPTQASPPTNLEAG